MTLAVVRGERPWAKTAGQVDSVDVASGGQNLVSSDSSNGDTCIT